MKIFDIKKGSTIKYSPSNRINYLFFQIAHTRTFTKAIPDYPRLSVVVCYYTRLIGKTEIAPSAVIHSRLNFSISIDPLPSDFKFARQGGSFAFVAYLFLCFFIALSPLYFAKNMIF